MQGLEQTFKPWDARARGHSPSTAGEHGRANPGSTAADRDQSRSHGAGLNAGMTDVKAFWIAAQATSADYLMLVEIRRRVARA
jgi:hypothetical protein